MRIERKDPVPSELNVITVGVSTEFYCITENKRTELEVRKTHWNLLHEENMQTL